MSRRRGRPRRDYRIKVRTQRRSKIDYESLARAVLEHAAMTDGTTNKSKQKPHLRKEQS